VSYRTRANMMMIGVNVFWGMSYVFMKMGLSSLGSFTIIALRCLIAFFIAGLFFYKPLRQITRKTIGSSAILGFLLFSVFSFVTFGVSMTSASNAGFLVSLTVIFVPLLNCFLVKKLPSWPIGLGIITTLTGIGVLTLKHSFHMNAGDLLCIGTALCYAIHITLTGTFTKNENPIALGILQLGFAGLFALTCSFLFEHPSIPTTLSSWIAILGLGVLCSAIGFICQAIAQRYTTPTHTGLIFATEPIFAALFAVLFLHELFTLKELIGSVIVVAGILIAQLDNFLLKKRVHYQETLPK